MQMVLLLLRSNGVNYAAELNVLFTVKNASWGGTLYTQKRKHLSLQLRKRKQIVCWLFSVEATK